MGMCPSTAPDFARGFRQRFEGDLAERLRVVFPVCHTTSSDTDMAEAAVKPDAGAAEDSDDDWGPWSAVAKRARVDSPVQRDTEGNSAAQSSQQPGTLEHEALWNLLQ